MAYSSRPRIASVLVAALTGGCAQRTVTRLEPAAPAPEPAATPSPGPATAPAPIDLGAFPGSPPPRWGVAVLALPRSDDDVVRPSSQWSARAQSRLEWNRIAAVLLEYGEMGELPGELESAVAAVAERPESSSVDLLLTGAVSTAGGPRVHLFVVDTGRRRLVARSEFEGRQIDRVLDEAVKDAIAEARAYWSELHRGEDIAQQVTVRGLQGDADLAACHRALASIPDVHLARQVETRLEGSSRTAVYILYFHGEAARLDDRLATARWSGTSGTVRLERRGDFELEAKHAGGSEGQGKEEEKVKEED